MRWLGTVCCLSLLFDHLSSGVSSPKRFAGCVGGLPSEQVRYDAVPPVYVVVNTVALICSMLSHVYLRFELGPIGKDAAGYDLGYSLGGKAAVQAFAKVIA